MRTRIRFECSGLSQGIGFRPKVFQFATECAIGGSVQNRSGSVRIEAEGSESDIVRFVERIRSTFAVSIDQRIPIEPLGESEFRILCSIAGGEPFQIDLPLDLPICGRCRKELFDSDNRRHDYPFISCTDCGPRFAILESLPYDRNATTYRSFPICPSCEQEYSSANDRRLHAQSIACPDCGPRLHLKNSDGKTESDGAALEQAADWIANGEVVAIKSIGGYHLVANATDEDAVRRLRAIKRRNRKPFAVMFRDLAHLSECFPLDETTASLIDSREKPIVIVNGKTEALAASVAPGLDRIGVFVAYTGIYALLLERLRLPIVVTSANRSEEPIPTSETELADSGAPLPVLDHPLEIRNGIDDSVFRVEENTVIPIRLGRSFAPRSFRLAHEHRKRILACGADLKNTFALAAGDRIILSPHTGDLESARSIERYQQNIERLLSLHAFSVEEIRCDLHPGYRSSRFARSLELPVHAIQHHFAHALALLVDCEIEAEQRLPVAVFDGTGYGEDETVWGGEFFRAGYGGFERLGHFEPFRLIGGDRAIKEGARSAASLLFDLYGEKALSMNLSPLLHLQETSTVEQLYAAWSSGNGTPSSSVGRLFDAAASILGLLQISDYEGEAGLLLERHYDPAITDHYPFQIENGIVLREEFFDALSNENNPTIGASRFINTIAAIAVAFFEPHGEIGITGGVFQNASLVRRIEELCRQKKMKLHRHTHIPPNDAGIAVGQAAWIRM